MNSVMPEVNRNVLPELHLRYQGATCIKKQNGKIQATFFFHDLLTGTVLFVDHEEMKCLDFVVALHRANHAVKNQKRHKPTN